MGLEPDAAVPVASPVHPANSTRVPGLTPTMLAFNPATANDPDTYHPVPLAAPDHPTKTNRAPGPDDSRVVERIAVAGDPASYHPLPEGIPCVLETSR